jgi:predicted Zn finger-like uncharacterized protein
MIIGCPGCRTRYLVDEQALGAGRLVRCATCGHTWHQKAPRELLPTDDLSRFAGSRIEPALEVPPRPAATPQPPAHPRRSHRHGVRWLVLVVLVVLAILAGVVIARGSLVKIWSPVARLFALAVLPVDSSGQGSVRMSGQ